MKTDYLKPLVKLPRSLYKILSTAQYTALRVIANKLRVTYWALSKAGRVTDKTTQETICFLSSRTLTTLLVKELIDFNQRKFSALRLTPKGRRVLQSVTDKIPV